MLIDSCLCVYLCTEERWHTPDAFDGCVYWVSAKHVEMCAVFLDGQLVVVWCVTAFSLPAGVSRSKLTLFLVPVDWQRRNNEDSEPKVTYKCLIFVVERSVARIFVGVRVKEKGGRIKLKFCLVVLCGVWLCVVVVKNDFQNVRSGIGHLVWIAIFKLFNCWRYLSE